MEFLFPSKKEELYYSLKEIFGFAPHNLNIYKVALCHRSMSTARVKGEERNNERLEYLGDAILESVVSDYLFRKYRERSEGFLTTARSKLVQRRALGKLAVNLGLDKLISASVLRSGHNSYIEGNAFEAIFGAIYLDRGYAHCQKFFDKIITAGYLDAERAVKKEQDFKSHLLEWGQKHHADVRFVSHQLDPRFIKPDEPPFSAEVIVEGLCLGHGKGFSKKESHQKAARHAINSIRHHNILSDRIERRRMIRCVVADMLNYQKRFA